VNPFSDSLSIVVTDDSLMGEDGEDTPIPVVVDEIAIEGSAEVSYSNSRIGTREVPEVRALTPPIPGSETSLITAPEIVVLRRISCEFSPTPSVAQENST
jgi:hypothetical protein